MEGFTIIGYYLWFSVLLIHPLLMVCCLNLRGKNINSRPMEKDYFLKTNSDQLILFSRNVLEISLF